MIQLDPTLVTTILFCSDRPFYNTSSRSHEHYITVYYTIYVLIKHHTSPTSPTLFLLVMDLLLKQLEVLGLILLVNNFNAGWFLHADDIRTLATSIDSLNVQVALVAKFAENSFLKL